MWCVSSSTSCTKSPASCSLSGTALLYIALGQLRIFWQGGASLRLKLEQLPGYAPDLNPDEGVWKHLKCVELKKLCCESLAQLRVELRKAKERLRHKKHVILGCIRQPGFEL
jgi:transposase